MVKRKERRRGKGETEKAFVEVGVDQVKDEKRDRIRWGFM
jgi:hypothetical protein